jgi:hypothetical protein
MHILHPIVFLKSQVITDHILVIGFVVCLLIAQWVVLSLCAAFSSMAAARAKAAIGAAAPDAIKNNIRQLMGLLRKIACIKEKTALIREKVDKLEAVLSIVRGIPDSECSTKLQRAASAAASYSAASAAASYSAASAAASYSAAQASSAHTDDLVGCNRTQINRDIMQRTATATRPLVAQNVLESIVNKKRPPYEIGILEKLRTLPLQLQKREASNSKLTIDQLILMEHVRDAFKKYELVGITDDFTDVKEFFIIINQEITYVKKCIHDHFQNKGGDTLNKVNDFLMSKIADYDTRKRKVERLQKEMQRQEAKCFFSNYMENSWEMISTNETAGHFESVLLYLNKAQQAYLTYLIKEKGSKEVDSCAQVEGAIKDKQATGNSYFLSIRQAYLNLLFKESLDEKKYKHLWSIIAHYYPNKMSEKLRTHHFVRKLAKRYLNLSSNDHPVFPELQLSRAEMQAVFFELVKHGSDSKCLPYQSIENNEGWAKNVLKVR